MRICPHCKAACSDSDRFCMKCGEPLPEGSNQEGAQIPVYQPPSGYAQYQKEEETIGIGRWLLYQIVLLIPIANIVMLFVWSFGNSEKNQTFRNWAKSRLIFLLIEVVFSILLVAVLVPIIISAASSSEVGNEFWRGFEEGYYYYNSFNG
ncbi:MAG: hypothetical protein DBX52_00080 [Clostridiales bacterium]|nr:MAG: hypothetical protein DBX52_00080 [Clostridiales bacterium]